MLCVYFEEAKQLALALGDMRANALIHAAYGRMLANGGSADEYVEKIREAKAIADQGNDPSVQITLKAVLCHALRISGRMSEALQMNIEAMDRAHEIGKFDRQTLGFDIDIWLTVMRGQTLVMLGRGEEARPFLDRILQLESGQVDAIHYVIPSLGVCGSRLGRGKYRTGSRACRPSVFHRREDRKPLSASLCPGLSWSFSHCRRKAHLRD